MANQVYNLGANELSFSFSGFKDESNGKCGSITYTSTLDGGAALPTFIVFSSTTKTFKVKTSDLVNIGTYKISIKGTLS